jgi:hypothetical protein
VATFLYMHTLSSRTSATSQLSRAELYIQPATVSQVMREVLAGKPTKALPSHDQLLAKIYDDVRMLVAIAPEALIALFPFCRLPLTPIALSLWPALFGPSINARRPQCATPHLLPEEATSTSIAPLHWGSYVVGVTCELQATVASSRRAECVGIL